MKHQENKNKIEADMARGRFYLLKKIIGSYKLFGVLILIVAGCWGIKKYSLQEKFDYLNAIKVSYVMERKNAMLEIKPMQIIDCLVAFARFSNSELWIDQVEYNSGYFDLIIHTNSVGAVNRYISNVQEFASLNIISKEINKESFLHNKQKKKQAEQAKAIPFAARKFMEYNKKRTKETPISEKEKNKVKNAKVADYKFNASVQLGL